MKIKTLKLFTSVKRSRKPFRIVEIKDFSPLRLYYFLNSCIRG
jgi:hypothetical protein